MVPSAKELIRSQAARDWNRARRGAFWRSLQASWSDKPVTPLLDMNEVAHKLHLRNTVYRGVQQIPIHKIVGSMGRYQDFTSEFLPRSKSMSERWRGVAAAVMDPYGKGVPPVEVYKAGWWYFVKDGNHRVSVAHQTGAEHIEAYIWEYTDPLPESLPEAGIEGLLLESERHDFLETTQLDKLYPNHEVRMTSLGGYTDLLIQIAQYQEALRKIDETEIPYDEAVKAWHDMIYEASVQLIVESGVLAMFPDRTACDFFVWIMKNRDELTECYEGKLVVAEGAREFVRRNRLTFSQRLRKWGTFPVRFIRALTGGRR